MIEMWKGQGAKYTQDLASNFVRLPKIKVTDEVVTLLLGGCLSFSSVEPCTFT